MGVFRGNIVFGVALEGVVDISGSFNIIADVSTGLSWTKGSISRPRCDDENEVSCCEGGLL